MTSIETTTLNALRAAVERIAGKNCLAISPDEDLNLDSINRISLIVEIENVFDVELDTEALVPEVFKTLSSLAAFVDAARAVQNHV